MKNLLIAFGIVLLTITTVKAQSDYRTFSQVQQELNSNGYNEVSNPGGYVLSWTGATVHFYHKAGVTNGIVVYQYGQENDIPQEAKNDCTHKASVESIGNPPVVIEKCEGIGKECKVVIKTDLNGKIYSVEWVCCGG